MLDAFRKLLAAEDWMPAKRVLQRDQEWWSRLRQDASIRFGTMAQRELSGKKLQMGDSIAYRFGNGRFVAHQLTEGRQPVCQMIVAAVSADQIYLALSKKLSEREISHLFDEEEWSKLPDLSSVSRLYVREHTPGLRDWITMQYQRQIGSQSGEKTLADGTIIPFRYSLFVSESNERALEIEIFGDGSYEIYSTLYRPLSDIVQVWPGAERQPLKPARVEVARQPAVTAAPSVQNSSVQPVFESASAKPDPVEERVVSSEPHEPDKELTSAEVIHLLSGRREDMTDEPDAPQTEVDESALACNIRVAAKIIDEAIRNDMQLSDVVRRVLGLPIAMDEKVHFQIPLGNRDYQVLAERYGVAPDDHEAIRAFIIEDLTDFTGEREQPVKKMVTG